MWHKMCDWSIFHAFFLMAISDSFLVFLHILLFYLSITFILFLNIFINDFLLKKTFLLSWHLYLMLMTILGWKCYEIQYYQGPFTSKNFKLYTCYNIEIKFNRKKNHVLGLPLVQSFSALPFTMLLGFFLELPLPYLRSLLYVHDTFIVFLVFFTLLMCTMEKSALTAAILSWQIPK